MPADPLRGGVHDQIGAVLQRARQSGRTKGVVHDERDTGGVRDFGNRREIGDVELRITDGFHEHGARLRIDCAAHGLVVVDVHELRRDAELREGVRELVVRAAIERARRDDVVAGPGEIEERQHLRRLSAGHTERPDASFELRHPLLEDIGRRVHDPRVDVAERTQPEQVCRVRRVVEHVARRGVDGDRARVGRRVGHLAGVDGKRVGMKRHGVPPVENGTK